jgi:HAD superfamily hydrolase (TIGR01490 family)
VIQTTVVFDLDGTLIDVDSAQAWLQFLEESNIADAAQARRICSALMQHYDAGSMDMATYMSAWLKPIKGFTLQQIEAITRVFVHQFIVPTVYPDALAKIRWHQAQGHAVAIISASPTLIVKPIADYLNVKHAIGIEVAIVDNKVTQIAIAPFSFKEGKVSAVNHWLSATAMTSLDYAYSDSSNDLPLLSLAQQAFCINPDPELSQHAKAQQWQTYYWSSKEQQ